MIRMGITPGEAQTVVDSNRETLTLMTYSKTSMMSFSEI